MEHRSTYSELHQYTATDELNRYTGIKHSADHDELYADIKQEQHENPTITHDPHAQAVTLNTPKPNPCCFAGKNPLYNRRSCDRSISHRILMIALIMLICLNTIGIGAVIFITTSSCVQCKQSIKDENASVASTTFRTEQMNTTDLFNNLLLQQAVENLANSTNAANTKLLTQLMELAASMKNELMNKMDQLITHGLNTAVAFMRNNTRDTLSSLAILTSAVSSTLSAFDNSSSSVTEDIIQYMENSLETLLTQYKILLRPASCKEIKDSYPDTPSGYYTINGEEIYCEMEELCGTEGGWTRLAYLDMTDTTVSCPSTLSYKTSSGIRACARSYSTKGSCSSVQFPSISISYSEVCGRVVGYQYKSIDATFVGSSDGKSIDSPYIEGISITHGSPRQHIWSLIAGNAELSIDSLPHSNCPCSSPPPGPNHGLPSFVGNDYFCESGNPTSSAGSILYSNDPLWDGKQCGGNETNCCSAAGLPWFHKTLSNATIDYIELRNCADQDTGNEDVYISFYEIYVK